MRSSRIDNIYIASPCTNRWEDMSGDDQVRFCAQCQLNVYNIAEMSRREAEMLIAAREGRLCVRLFRRADGTVITKDCPVGLRAIKKRIAKTASMLLALLLSCNSDVKARILEKPELISSPNAPTVIKNSRAKNDSVISGRIFDETGEPIADAEITVLNEQSGWQQQLKTDANGQFSFSKLTPGFYTVELFFYEQGAIKHIEVKKGRNAQLEVTLSLFLMGDLVCVKPKVIDNSSGKFSFLVTPFKKLAAILK